VWAEIVGDALVGPHVLPYQLTGNHYRDFLLHDLPKLLEDVPPTVRAWVWYMHDGTPAHFGHAVRDVLNNTYYDRWIGRGGPTACPPCSPDLSPLDVYLWGHIKPLCMQLLLTMKRHFTIASPMPVRLSPTTPVSMIGCSGPWWDVLRRALNLMEDILSTSYKCTLSAITHKWNVFEHMLIWTFFLVLVCGTCAQSLSAPFSYTLYISDIWSFTTLTLMEETSEPLVFNSIFMWLIAWEDFGTFISTINNIDSNIK
jgi:hypothetical protein